MLSFHEMCNSCPPYMSFKGVQVTPSPCFPPPDSEPIQKLSLEVRGRGMNFIYGYKEDVARTQQHSRFYGPGQE